MFRANYRGSLGTGGTGDMWIPGCWAPCQLGYPCFYIRGTPGIQCNGGTGGYVDTWLLSSVPTTLSLILFRGNFSYPVLWWYWWILDLNHGNQGFTNTIIARVN